MAQHKRVVFTSDSLEPLVISNRVTLAMLEELVKRYRKPNSRRWIEDVVETAYLRK